MVVLLMTKASSGTLPAWRFKEGFGVVLMQDLVGQLVSLVREHQDDIFDGVLCPTSADTNMSNSARDWSRVPKGGFLPFSLLCT